jgi:hypothetical protein
LNGGELGGRRGDACGVGLQRGQRQLRLGAHRFRMRALQFGDVRVVPPAVREPASGARQRHCQQQAQAGHQRAVLDRDYGSPFRHSSRSAWRRRVRPRTSLPPTLFHISSALQAPTMSPTFVRRAMLDPQKPLTPML